MPGSRVFLCGSLSGLGKVLRHAFAALDELLGLPLILLGRSLQVLRINLMHFWERLAAHKLAGNRHVLVDAPVDEIHPLGRSQSYAKRRRLGAGLDRLDWPRPAGSAGSQCVATTAIVVLSVQATDSPGTRRKPHRCVRAGAHPSRLVAMDAEHLFIEKSAAIIARLELQTNNSASMSMG
jgi:hypothetical protein